MPIAQKLLQRFYTKSNSKGKMSPEKEKEYLDILSSGSTEEKVGVASDTNSSDKVLEKAWKDSNPKVRIAVAKNTSSHDLLLVKALCDDSDSVFNAVVRNENLKPKVIQVALSSLRADAEAELKKISGQEDVKKLWKIQKFLFKGTEEEEFTVELPELPPEPPEDAQFGAPPPNARKVMRIADYLGQFLVDPRTQSTAVPTGRRDVLSVFKGKEEVTWKELVAQFGGKGQAEAYVKRVFGDKILADLKQGGTLKKSDTNKYIPADNADIRISEIDKRYGEQAIKGNTDEFVTFNSANIPDNLSRFWDIHQKNQIASGHPTGFAFSLFTRFDGGKSAVITQIQSDLFSLLEDPVKRNMIQRRIPDGRNVVRGLEQHFSDYKKTWPVFVFRNTYRKLREAGVEKVFLGTPEGLKKIGASPPLSLIQSVMSKKFASKEGLGSEEMINVDGVEFPAYGSPSPEVDAELRESKKKASLAERLQSLIIDIQTDKRPQAGMINIGYGKQDLDTPAMDADDEPPEQTPKNVEGFDLAQSNYSMQGLFTDAVHASDGGFRYSESMEQNVKYVPATVGYAKKAKIKRILELREENVYNSRSDAVDAITMLCHKKGLKEGTILSVVKTPYNKYKVVNIDSFSVS